MMALPTFAPRSATSVRGARSGASCLALSIGRQAHLEAALRLVPDARAGAEEVTGREKDLHGLVEAAARRMASALFSMSASVVAQEQTLMRIAVRFCQTVTPHQQVPSACTASITRRVRSGPPNDTRTWFKTTSLRIS